MWLLEIQIGDRSQVNAGHWNTAPTAGHPVCQLKSPLDCRISRLTDADANGILKCRFMTTYLLKCYMYETQTCISNHNLCCWKSCATIEKHVGWWTVQADCWNLELSANEHFYLANRNSTLTVGRQTWQLKSNSTVERTAWLLKFQCGCWKENLILEARIKFMIHKLSLLKDTLW